jgi:hypothetical protein
MTIWFPFGGKQGFDNTNVCSHVGNSTLLHDVVVIKATKIGIPRIKMNSQYIIEFGSILRITIASYFFTV